MKKRVLNRQQVTEFAEFLEDIVHQKTETIKEREERGFDLNEDESSLDTQYVTGLFFNRIRIGVEGRDRLTSDDYTAIVRKAADEIYRPDLEKRYAEELRDDSIKAGVKKYIESRMASFIALQERLFTEYYEEEARSHER